MKVVLLEVSLKNFIFWVIQRHQTEGESRVTQSIVEDLHFSDIQGDQMEGEGGVT